MFDYIDDIKDSEKKALLKARDIIAKYNVNNSIVMDSPDKAKDYFVLYLSHLKRENMMVMFLRNDHSLIHSEIMFKGSINSCTVDPTEIVRMALSLGSTAIILAHNHPSGNSTPSQPDIELTSAIKERMEMFNIRLLDHIIVGSTTLSLADEGML